METAISNHQQYIAGKFSMQERLEERLRRLESTREYNAFVYEMGQHAREQAARLDARRDAGELLGKLAGTIIAIKDNICIKGHQASCGSHILQSFISPYHATCISRILAEDGLIIGKTNLDEFAMGSSTENSVYGPARNPYAADRVAGGSSGGSAIAVALKIADLALGSDTGGSIRQPASFCGVVGLKPSYGRVSRYGLVAYASSLDQVGPFAATVEDAALMLEVISGHDPHDSTSAPEGAPVYHKIDMSGVESLKFGLPRQYFQDGLDPEIRQRLDRLRQRLTDQGASVEFVDLPLTEYAIAAYYIIATAEASSNLSRYDGVRYGYRAPDTEDLNDMYTDTRNAGFGREAQRRIMLGTFVLSAGYYDAYYKKAQQVRRQIQTEYQRIFNQVDILFTPTTPTAAFKIGERIDNPLQMYLSDIYTVPANLAGICALNVPAGFTAAGLPFGAQLLAGAFQEEKLLAAGKLLEGLAAINVGKEGQQ